MLADSSLDFEHAPAPENPVTFHRIGDSDAPPRVDGLFLNVAGQDLETRTTNLRPLRLKIKAEGSVFAFDDCETLHFGESLELFASMGLMLYQGWRVALDTGEPVRLVDSPEPGQGPYLFRFQRERYDPVSHARIYLRDLDHMTAMNILQAVPDHWFRSEEERGYHAAELLLALLAQDRRSGPHYRLEHFKAALHQYNRACTWIPDHGPVYSCMAAFWRGIGRADLGRRLLDSVYTVTSDVGIGTELAGWPTETLEFEPVNGPDYQPSTRLRLLYLCHPESDFGSDVLHDGLRRVLGQENVVAYPWKPVLHGQEVEKATGYPCTFNWADDPVPLEEIVRQAEAGAFDAILYSDTLGMLPRKETRQLLDAAAGTPLFVLDMWDECGDMLAHICARDDLGEVAGYFKREMLRGHPYPEQTWPLPFSFPEDRIPATVSWADRDGIFWAGKLMGGARRLQVAWLEKQLPLSVKPGTPYTPEAYAERLQEHLLGLSLPGNGFDTVRYWELPAHGTLLLAERPPLAIPHDFVGDKHAVFCDTVSELKDKAEYYLSHPGEAIAIAQAGHAHLLEYHTGSARARQCLARIQQRIAELQPNS
jgi:hypothetical protein